MFGGNTERGPANGNSGAIHLNRNKRNSFRDNQFLPGMDPQAMLAGGDYTNSGQGHLVPGRNSIKFRTSSTTEFGDGPGYEDFRNTTTPGL